MKLTDQDAVELIELGNAAVDGRLTGPQRERLGRRLVESEEARRFYVQFMGLSADLSLAAAESLAGGAEPAGMGEHGALDRWRAWLCGWPWRRAAIGMAVGAAACLAIAGAWWSFNRGTGSYLEVTVAESGPVATAGSDGLAVLTHAAGLIWADTNHATLDVGAALSPGWLRLQAGVIQLEFKNGAQVILEGPAEFRLVSGGAGRLHFGRLSAQVPAQAGGFSVRSAGVDVTDLGTEFGLNKPPGGSLDVQVFVGRVKFSVADTNQPVRELTTGQGMRIQPRRMHRIRADRGAFVTAPELRRRETAELRARYEAWKQGSRALDRDAALLVHFNFEDQRPLLANLAAAPPPDTRGTIVDCRWVEGRWPDKGALQFRGRNDRVQFKVPGTFKSLTYMAWARVDSLPNTHNGLALTERRKPGEVHWQLSRDGRLELSARFALGDRETDWERLSSRPMLKPEQFGRWVHLAAVYDGPRKIMALYFNGQPVASKPIEEPLDLVLDAVELGNWARRAPVAAGPNGPDDLAIRDFHGRMDEFALFSRPLSAEEIRRLYELGRPRAIGILATASRPSRLAKKP